MKQLESLLDRRRADGHRHARSRENLADGCRHDDDVIRPLDRPFADKPPIVVLHGSLAPESAIVKLGVRRRRSENAVQRSGQRLRQSASSRSKGSRRGEVTPGQVLVVRGMGPKGGPAMAGSASQSGLRVWTRLGFKTRWHSCATASSRDYVSKD